MAAKPCKANVGTRSKPRECGQAVAKGMLAACHEHATTMIATSTPGIYTRGGQYVAVWRHRGKQHKSFHRTLAQAREAKANHTGTARPAPQSRRHFDEYAMKWIETCQGRTRRGFDEDTRQSYRRALELYAIPHLGSRPLRDIERRDITSLVSKLQARGLAAASISAYIAPLRALFADAVEEGDMTANPAVGLKINAKAARPDSDDDERAKEMTRTELAAILNAIPAQHRLVFDLMANTGCRISEALGLDWSDVTFGDAPTLRISRQWYRGKLKQPKTTAGSRVIDLPPGLAARLWDLGADATGPIAHTKTGRRLSDRNLTRVLDAARDRAGVPGVTHHTFRHTHGSILLDEGWSIAEVADRLGHADPSITARVYAHKMRDRRRSLGFLDALDAVEVEGNGWATAGQRNSHKQPQTDGAVILDVSAREQAK